MNDEGTLDDLSYLLTIMIKEIHPSISEEVTYELLQDLFDQDLNEFVMVEYGQLIKRSAGSPATKRDVH